MIICVPTLRLQKQWISQLIGNTKVYVVNTLALLNEECDLLVLDEAHRYGTDYFRGSFENTKYNKLLCVTATIERNDGLHKILLKRAPIFDRVTIKECLDNNWVNDYTVYNVGLELYPDERELMDKANSSFEYYAELLGGKHNAWTNASNYIKKEYWNELIEEAELRLSEAEKESEECLAILEEIEAIRESKKENSHYARQYMKAVRNRKKIIYNARRKTEFAHSILKRYHDRKKILFCQTVSFATTIDKMIGNTSVTIHSKMTEKQCSEALNLFEDDESDINTICSVKALNEGLDVKDCTLGVSASGTSSKIDGVQMLGRVIRLNNIGVKSIFANLYIVDTQDYFWVKNRTSDIPQSRISWIRR